MKIVVLNEVFLEEKQIERLKALGELEVFKDTDNIQKATERIKNADIIVADPFVTPLTREVLNVADNLKLIALSVIGFDTVDMDAANKKGIKIANIPGFSTEAVAEMAIGLMLAVFRNIPLADKKMREKPFEVDAGNPSHAVFKGVELRGKTLGIIGLGRIGQRTAELGKALGMKVVAYDRKEKNLENITQFSLEEVLRTSDVISLHLSFAPELENIISEESLNFMKSSAILINTARGKHVNEEALYRALTNEKLAGAGLDVIVDWSERNPLLKLENVVLTPHQGYLTDDSVKNMAEMVVDNVEAFVKGTPKNIVN